MLWTIMYCAKVSVTINLSLVLGFSKKNDALLRTSYLMQHAIWEEQRCVNGAETSAMW